MNVEEMAAKILQIVEGHPQTTFAELRKYIGKEMDGDYRFGFPQNPNIVLWSDVNETFIDAFQFVKDKLFVVPTTFLVYAMDGQGLTLPIAKHLKHKTPHWVPTVISIRTPENQTEIDRAGTKHKRRSEALLTSK